MPSLHWHDCNRLQINRGTLVEICTNSNFIFTTIDRSLFVYFFLFADLFRSGRSRPAARPGSSVRLAGHLHHPSDLRPQRGDFQGEALDSKPLVLHRCIFHRGMPAKML